MDAATAYTLLSGMYIAADTAGMPFYPNLFGVCPTGDNQTRTVQGTIPCNTKDIKMSSMGWFGI